MTDRDIPPSTISESDIGSALPSIWPTGSAGLDRQLHERGYDTSTATDTALMPPAVAEYAITALSRPGDIVLDPECGAGTTITEALHAGRHAIGLTATRRWWHLARTNISRAKARGAPVDGMVLVLTRHRYSAATAATAGLVGRVDLLLTSLRPKQPVLDTEQAVTTVRERLAEYRPLLRPGGHVVIAMPPLRHPLRHHLLDVPAAVQAAATSTGLACVARCWALTASVHGQKARTRASVATRRHIRRIEQATGHPCALPAALTTLVFRTDPEATDPAIGLPHPDRSDSPWIGRMRPVA